MNLMYGDAVESILAQIRRLPTNERVALADEVDRLAWRDRMQIVLDRINANIERDGLITDAEIDALVEEVRSEKSLYERYRARRQLMEALLGGWWRRPCSLNRELLLGQTSAK